MLEKTKLRVDEQALKQCAGSVHSFTDFKTALNEPTGDFFYEPWTVKEEYKRTAFQKVLDQLSFHVGEARNIALSPMNCYTQHADIDDRYHLNITGDGGYLLDLNNQKIHKTENDGIWYIMNTGMLHTAVSCGEYTRYQLVVRQLLTRHKLQDPVCAEIYLEGKNARFSFDNYISPWLNFANKNSIITDFAIIEKGVSFQVEKQSVAHLGQIIPPSCRLEFV